MTPTEQWIMDLALVYSVPSFLSGIAVTLLFVHWRGIRRAAAIVPSFLAPKLVLAGRDPVSAGTTPADCLKA